MEPDATVTRKRYTIAVIDDDLALHNALKHLLSAHGYDVELYSTTLQFLQDAKVTAAKCLIVDCQVGSSSGIQMVKDLWADGIRLPTIFLTGSNDDNLRNQAIALNCIAYLRKPAGSEQLINAIKTAITRAHFAP